MADVNVEFGAKDTGLEATLKTVQEQMTKLEAEVKSGTLSFEELSQKMRQLSQAESINEKLRDIGDASAEARPKVDALGNTVLDAGKKSDQSAGLFDESFQKIAGAFTVGNLAAMGFEKAIDLAFSAARAVVDAFGQALDLGGRLNDLSARTGETAGKLLVLEQAFKDSGLSADQVGVAINKLQNFMAEAQAGGEAQAQAMQRLGISMADLAGKTPTQQMEVFAQAISKIEDPTQRAAIAGDVFGEKLGGRLLPLLTQFSPALDDAGTKVGSLADVMDENAAIFDQTGETIEAVQGKLAAFAAGILGETIPAIQGMGTAMEEVDAAGFGEKIGEMIAPSLRSVTAQIDLLNQGLGFLGQKLKEVAGIGSESSQEFEFMGLKFGEVAGIIGQALPSQFLPLKLALQGIGEQSGEAAAAQGEAGAAIEQTGNKANEASAKLSLMPSATDGTLENITGINAGLTTTGSLLDSQNITLGTINSGYDLWMDAGKEINSNEEQRIAFYDAQREKVDAIVAGLNQTLQTGINIGGLNFGNIGGMASVTANAKSNMEGIKTVGDAMQAMPVPEPFVGMAEKTAQAREQIEKFGNYIGVDLTNMSFPDIVDELNIPGTFSTMSQQIDAIMAYIDQEMAEPVELKITTDFDPNLVLASLEEPIKLNLGFDPNQVLVPLEQEEVNLDLSGDDSIKTIKKKLSAPIDMVFTDGLGFVPMVRKNLEKPFNLTAGNVAQESASARNFFKQAFTNIPLTVDPDDAQIQGAIANMTAQISNEFTGGEGGQGGQGGQGGPGGDATANVSGVEGILNGHTPILEAIRDRLPLQALVY